jgi:hypothetical protein
LAYLEFDDSNIHDTNAVRVVVQGQTIGHLPAAYAATYRSYLTELPSHIVHVAVFAAITGGLQTDQRQYEYTVELDIPDSLMLRPVNGQIDDEVVRFFGYEPLQLIADGSYAVKVWLPVPDIGELHPKLLVQEWTTDSWKTINYYARDRQGIGLGFKLYEIGKSEHARLFGDLETVATLVLGEERFATLHIQLGRLG